jgi:hypothetical protein
MPGDLQALTSIRIHDGSFGDGKQLGVESVGEQVNVLREPVGDAVEVEGVAAG